MHIVPKLPSKLQSYGRVGAWITLTGLIGFCFPLPISLVILLFLGSLLNNTSKLTLLQLFQDLKKMSKHNDLFPIPSGHFISLFNFFLLLVLQETTALKELLPSHRCAAGERASTFYFLLF